MATTWIKALHRSGGSVAAALELRVDYAKDAEKTDGGELVTFRPTGGLGASSPPTSIGGSGIFVKMRAPPPACKERN